MNPIEEKIQKSIAEFEQKFEGSLRIKEYTEISKRFDSLVKKGIVKRRGNNLLSITDVHLKDRVLFNVQKV